MIDPNIDIRIQEIEKIADSHPDIPWLLDQLKSYDDAYMNLKLDLYVAWDDLDKLRRQLTKPITET